MSYQSKLDQGAALEENAKFKDAYEIYASVLYQVSLELIDHSKVKSISQSDHKYMIDTINDCAHKLQVIYNKLYKMLPPPVPQKPKSLNRKFIQDYGNSPPRVDIPEPSLNGDNLKESPTSFTSSALESDVSSNESTMLSQIPKSDLIKLYQKLINRDPSLKISKDLFGGYSNREELLQSVMNYIHLSASLIEIIHIRPFYFAFQICLIDQEIFRRILPSDFLNPNQPKSSIESSTHFFNYLCRTVEHTALNPSTSDARAAILEYWIKTSKRLYQLRNFQSLKAITSALQSPPLHRLKASWALVAKKKIKDLNALLEFCSEQDNYSHYRQWLKLNISKPMIPYLGIYLHDLTYLAAMEKKTNSVRKNSMEILDQIRYFQSEPYYSYKYFTSLLTESIYSKPRKPPIIPTAPVPIQSLNSMNDESVGLFISHWILTQKVYPEKMIDELSLIREPRESTNLIDRRETDSVNDSGKLIPSLGSYKRNIMNSIKSSMGISRKIYKRASWSSL